MSRIQFDQMGDTMVSRERISQLRSTFVDLDNAPSVGAMNLSEIPKLLIVDDERVIADTLSIILRQQGYDCASAYDGVEAIEKARQLRPQFILMDICMPNLDGASAGRIILDEQPDCKIVFMTGARSNEAILKTCFKDPAYVLCWKPIPPREVLRLLVEAGLTSPLNYHQSEFPQ